MNNILKTASIVTSGFLVGAIVRKYAHLSKRMSKLSLFNKAKKFDILISKGKRSEDINNYFI